ncbi:MAG: DUF3240 family protein [Thiotrichaceae bacterium]|nr:DUF3240 family protein [Thiotrichaceae bacterium]
MVSLYSEKMLNIICNDSLEEKIVCMFKKYGVSGYTILTARGEGSSGHISDMSGFDANIMVKVILPESRMQVILESIERKIKKGYHLTIYITNVEVISPEKFEKTIS